MSFPRANNMGSHGLPGDDVAQVLFGVQSAAGFDDPSLWTWLACHSHFACDTGRPGLEGLRLLSTYLIASGALAPDAGEISLLGLVMDRLAEYRNGRLQDLAPLRFETAIPTILDLIADIEALYRCLDQASEVRLRRLVAATLSSTLCCMPSCHPFQLRGMAIAGLTGLGSWSQWLHECARWMSQHHGEVGRVQARLAVRGNRFPPWEIADLYFWTVARPFDRTPQIADVAPRLSARSLEHA